MAIRSKMQVTREQAKLIYRKQNPKYQKTYAEVTQLSISSGATAAERQGGSRNPGGDMGREGLRIVVLLGEVIYINKIEKIQKQVPER